jgi:hypothetical protein
VVTVTAIDRRPAWLSSGLAGTLAAIVALVHGFSVGHPLAAVVGLLGAVGLYRVAGLLAVNRTETPRGERAGTTLGLVVSLFVLLAPTTWLGLTASVVIYLPLLGVVLVGLASADAITGEHADAFISVWWRTRDVFVLGAAVLAVIQTGVAVTLVTAGSRGFLSVTAWGVVPAILLLEALGYLLVVCLPMAQRELDARVGTERTERVATITVGDALIEESLGEVKAWIHNHVVLVIGQIVLLVLATPYLEGLLLSAGPAGVWIRTISTAGFLHVIVLVPLVLSMLVLAGAFVHELVTAQLWIDPPAMATDAVGGLLAVLAVGTLSLVIPETVSEIVVSEYAARLARFYGPGAVLLGVLAVLALSAPIVLSLASSGAVVMGLASDRSSGFLLGASAVLLGSIVAAEAGVSALVVFVGIAAAILVWELGEQASYLGTTIGSDGISDGVEAVHAAAALGVAVVGIAVASIVGYVIGPLTVAPERALLGIALSLVAAVFVVATTGDSSSP